MLDHRRGAYPTVEISDDGTEVVVGIHGTLDVWTSRQLAAALAEALASAKEDGTRVVLDLASLDVVDPGLAGLIRRGRELARGWGTELVLRAPPSSVYASLQMSGLAGSVEWPDASSEAGPAASWAFGDMTRGALPLCVERAPPERRALRAVSDLPEGPVSAPGPGPT